jgi:hypothetical protein
MTKPTAVPHGYRKAQKTNTNPFPQKLDVARRCDANPREESRVHVYIFFDRLPELDRPSLGILVLIAVSRARPLANAYSAVHLSPLHHASLRHRLASIVSLTPLASPASLACMYVFSEYWGWCH